MSESGNTSFVEDESKVNIEETFINFDCVKNEPNEELLDFEDDSQVKRYKITLEYENIFGETSHQTKFEEDYDNLVGFMDNDVVMENTIIKLETIKEDDDGSSNNFHCSKCKEIYNGYCLKCSILLHILNNNLGNVKSETDLNNIPTNILEIRETSRGKGVYLLRTLPKNIIFGPFEGILGIESTVGHSWQIVNNKFRNIECGNWMKNIISAPNAALKNLEIFQNDGNLYFQTNREIIEGEELLIHYDDEKLQSLDNSEYYLYTPQKLEKLSKIFACTVCCFGFGSNICLMEHRRKSCRMKDSRSMKDFVLVECYYCKMWLEKSEHEEYHLTYCMEKHHRMWSDYSEVINRNATDDSDTKNDERMKRMNNKSHSQRGLNKRRGIEFKPFACDTCTKKFTLKGNLTKHIKNKHTDDGSAKEYKCSECHYQTNYKHCLQRHLHKHKEIKLKPYTCDICVKKFEHKASLQIHMKIKHIKDGSVKNHKCLECSYQTNNKTYFHTHLNKHRGIKPYKCDICMMTFGQKGNLKAHMKNKHTADETAKDYKCSECSYQTNHKNNFQMHLNKHKGIKPFECNICMQKFGQKAQLTAHVRNKHIDYVRAKDYKLEFSYQITCDICLMKFTQKSSLARHIKNKHADNESIKDYKCLECGYQTNYKSSLQKHLNKHNGVKPFKCDICMMQFVQKCNLKTHIRNKHTDDENAKDYKCLECPYQTNSKHHFQMHLNKHKGIKPFKCDICMKKFGDKSNLKAHVRNKHADYGNAKN